MGDTLYRVNEIFYSIEGEGIRSGLPALFIRLHGCNLRCSYCDSLYACEGDDYTEMPFDAILDKLYALSSCCKKVTLTGGEPLIQNDVIRLINGLTNNGYEVNVETNGSVNLKDFYQNLSIPESVIFTMDWKSDSSLMSMHNLVENLAQLRETDVLKFVVGSKCDLEQMKTIARSSGSSAQMFVSPVFGEIEASEIVDFIKLNELTNIRMQLQIHKFIWDPQERGV